MTDQKGYRVRRFDWQDAVKEIPRGPKWFPPDGVRCTMSEDISDHAAIELIRATLAAPPAQPERKPIQHNQQGSK